MPVQLIIRAKTPEREKSWTRQFREIAESYSQLNFSVNTSSWELAQIVVLDQELPDLEAILERDRQKKVILLVVDESTSMPGLLKSQKVDDVLIFPFRPLEIYSRLHFFDQVLGFKDLNEVNAAISEVIKNLKNDFLLVERMQKAKVPKRFPHVKGFQVSSRYFSGMKSGGDHFDLAESKDGKSLSLLLSNSTSYGLSSAILSVMMRIAVKLSSDRMSGTGAVTEVVRHIYDELQLVMKDKDRFSLFFGNIIREQHKLNFLNFGTSSLFYAHPGEDFQELKNHGEGISRTQPFDSPAEQELLLQPQGRLILISEGFRNVLGDATQTRDFLNRWKQKPALDLLNDLAFRIKSTVS